MQQYDLFKVSEFIRNHSVASYATVSKDNKPHVATIYYVVDQDLSFYFATRSKTRKYLHAVDNNNVALVITDEQLFVTVQIEGKAQFLNDPKEIDWAAVALAQIQQSHAGVTPIQRIPAGEYVFVKVIPTWMRAVNFAKWLNLIEYETPKDYLPKSSHE